jgi:xanthine/uracil permease
LRYTLTFGFKDWQVPGNQTMIRKFFLLIFMIIPLLGAIITNVPLPVLVGMAGLILFGLIVVPGREQQ